MINDFSVPSGHDEMERNAYNAAFYELGFRWHWDSDTFEQLQRQSSNAAEQIRHYLKTHQPHLLKAYDAAFLVDVIQQKKALHRKRGTASGQAASGHFDWAQSLGCELGA